MHILINCRRLLIGFALVYGLPDCRIGEGGRGQSSPAVDHRPRQVIPPRGSPKPWSETMGRGPVYQGVGLSAGACLLEIGLVWGRVHV